MTRTRVTKDAALHTVRRARRGHHAEPRPQFRQSPRDEANSGMVNRATQIRFRVEHDEQVYELYSLLLYVCIHVDQHNRVHTGRKKSDTLYTRLLRQHLALDVLVTVHALRPRCHAMRLCFQLVRAVVEHCQQLVRHPWST